MHCYCRSAAPFPQEGGQYRSGAGLHEAARQAQRFYYLSHQTTGPDHGIITAVTVTPGDVHDSRPSLEQLEYVHKNVVPLQAAAADSAYDFPLAHRALEELGIDFFAVAQPVHDRTKDEQRDVYLCPNGKELRWEPEYREALKQRQIWCEGTFAAQKWGHNLTRLLRRGLEAAEDHCLLSAAALNLKK